MSIQKKVSEGLRKDGVHLSEDDLQSILRLLNSLAKIEYEVYRQQKSKSIHGQSPDPQDIGLNHQNLAA